MKLLRNPVLMVVGLLALAMLVMPGCTKKPKAPNQDIQPNTYVTTYQIATLPDSATVFNVTVYWRASDPDGQVEAYRYWIGAADVPDSLKTFTTDTFVSIKLNFATAADIYNFNVQARDNEGVWDATPAVLPIDMNTIRHGSVFAPQTIASTVPPDGALTSSGVHLIVTATDIDGFVPYFQHAIDSATTWVTDSATIILEHQSTIELNVNDLSLGPHIIYVRGVDNMGNVDESPISTSFVVVDSLRPDLSLVSGVIPNAFYFLPSGGTTVDLNTAWNGDATWYFSNLQFRYAVDDSAQWSAWRTTTTATLTGLAAGAHQFFVQAMDQAGNITVIDANFGIGQLTGDRGILVVNGIDWASYSPQPETMYVNKGPFGNHTIHFWDLFPGSSSYYPPNIAAAYMGSGIIPGDTLGHFSSVVFVMNNFSSGATTDLDDFNTMFPLIMSYLNGGGNVILATRYGSSFITGDLLTYGVTTALVFNEIGVNPAPGGLVKAGNMPNDITSIGSWSLSDLLAPSTDPNVTTLFTTPDYPGSVGGVIVQPAGKGKFAFVAGRPYRFNAVEMATDFGYILTLFGEQ